MCAVIAVCGLAAVDLFNLMVSLSLSHVTQIRSLTYLAVM